MMEPSALKMDRKKEFVNDFQKDIVDLLGTKVFQPGTESLQDLLKKGHGDLEEGIRTTMKIGDFELMGDPEDAPEESSVLADHEYFYKGKMNAPLASLLPTIHVSGTEETKPGCWRVLYESDKSRLWAFLRMLSNMMKAGLMGNEHQEARCTKILTELLETLPVVIVKMKAEDELWAEWNRAQTTGHNDLQHSTDRGSNRYTFFAKMKEALKVTLKNEGNPKEVTTRQLFEAYKNAETEQKFRTAKGMTGVKRENELSQLMKWGDFMTKIGLMDIWKSLEVLPEGKTVFFKSAFGSSFCGLAGNDEEIAEYVLTTLTDCISDRKWLQRVMEANAERMKSIVKTFVLQWKWAKHLCEACRNRAIMSAEKAASDFAVIGTAFSRMDAIQVMEDSTGKKANLHPLSLELWETCHRVLWMQAHFNAFQSADALNKNFQNTVQIEALQNLCVPNIMNPWTDAHTQFAGQVKKNKIAVDDDEEENKDEKSTQIQLPTRKDAIKMAARNELELFAGTSFVKTGDPALDREKMFQCEIAKPRTAHNAQYNPETQGNRRGTVYDEKGRRNPKWQYVNGRNKYRSKISFQKDDFEEFVDTWAIMAKVGEEGKKHKVDVFLVWNAEQDRASAVILKKLRSMFPGMEGQVKKTLLKGVQAHVERRLWDGEPEGEVGELAGLPGMVEELFEAYSGPLPFRRKHILKMGGIVDNMYPEEIVPLRNPKKSEPVVSVEVQKAIFPPDDDKPHDGVMVVRNDEVWAPYHVCSCLLWMG